MEIRQILVDGYGAAATNATWTVLTEQLLLANDKMQNKKPKQKGEKLKKNKLLAEGIIMRHVILIKTFSWSLFTNY